MITTLTPSLRERKRILKIKCRKHKQWKWRISLAAVLFCISFLIIVAFIVLLCKHPLSPFGSFIFGCATLSFSCVPFFIALSVKNTAKFKCGQPYTSYANGTLILNDVGLEYIFWRVGPREPAAYSSKRAVYKDEDKFVFRISCNEITSIDFQDDICFIKGNGKTIMPEWAIEDQTVKESFNCVSFALAFEQINSEQIINEWRSKNVKF